MAKIAFVGEAWGAFEAKAQRPFVGVSGHELFTQLCEAGILQETSEDRRNRKDFWYYWRIWADNGRADINIVTTPMERIWDAHPEIYLTNVFNLRPPDNNIENICVTKKEDQTGLPPIKAGKYPLSDIVLLNERRLQDELLYLRPNLIIALGGIATWRLLRNPSITKLRGAIASAVQPFEGKVLPVFHPAGILREYSNRNVTILDLVKARSESSFPEIRRPKRKILIPESLDDLYTIQKMELTPSLAPDIETLGEIITCIGFGFSPEFAAVIPFFDPRKPDNSYWRTHIEERIAWKTVLSLASRPGKKYFQNCLFDINRVWKATGITFAGDIEDTMLMHHALQPESPKGLDFLASVYTNEAAWKLMRTRKKDVFKRED